MSQFDPIGIVSKLHACMGDGCYCKPGNENKWRWSEDDKRRLKDAIKAMVASERKAAP